MQVTNATLLKVFLSRRVYERYSKYVDTDWLAEEAQQIFRDFESYFKKIEGNIELEEFSLWFNEIAHPDFPKSKKKLYGAIFANMSEAETLHIEDLLVAYKQKAIRSRLVEHLTSEEELDKSKITKMLDAYNSTISASLEEGYVDNDLDRILQTTNRSEGLRWRLDCLNKALPPLKRGDFALVAAYVGTGKTTFAVSEMVNMAKQLKSGNVLWLNNEEFDDRVLQKIWCSTLGKPWDVIKAHPGKAREAYERAFKGDQHRIKLFNIRFKSIRHIERLCHELKPELIVIDQADKIAGTQHKEGAEHLRIENLYSRLRSIANEYAPLIAVTQTDSSVRRKDNQTGEVEYCRIIDYNQLASSKIGKPAEADIIVTIGADRLSPNSRFISVPKTKMSAPDPNFQNLRGYEVIFRPEVCRYENPK